MLRYIAMFNKHFFQFERHPRLFEKGDLKYVILNLLKEGHPLIALDTSFNSPLWIPVLIATGFLVNWWLPLLIFLGMCVYRAILLVIGFYFTGAAKHSPSTAKFRDQIMQSVEKMEESE